MRFLKNKIERSAEIKRLHLQKGQPLPSVDEPNLKAINEGEFSPLTHLQKKNSKSRVKPDHLPRKTSCENIIKNYGRAMTNFALSSLAIPYLKIILPKHGSNLTDFLSFIKKKRSANCIKKLRELLPYGGNRDAPNYSEKLVFQELCVVFLKFFSVNWLWNSKIDNKPTHLAYRFKILRRIRDPDHFTYLKDFKFDSK